MRMIIIIMEMSLIVTMIIIVTLNWTYNIDKGKKNVLMIMTVLVYLNNNHHDNHINK